MRGFLVFDFAEQYEAARSDIRGWLGSGELKSLTDEVNGLSSGAWCVCGSARRWQYRHKGREIVGEAVAASSNVA